MDWQQKAAALDALAPIQVMIREPGDWYINQATEIGGNGLLHGVYGNGRTPQEAIENHWSLLTKLEPGFYIVTDATDRERRRHRRWNGFMWQDFPVQRRDR